MPNSPWHVRSRNEDESVVPVLVAVQDFLASTDVKRLDVRTKEEYSRSLLVFAHWCAAHSLVQKRTDKSWYAVSADETHETICLHQITDQAVQCFLEYLKATRTPSKAEKEQLSGHTLDKYVQVVKRFLNWCLDDEQYSAHVQARVVSRIKNPPIEEVILDTFTPEQIEALFRACEQEESLHLQMRDKAILSLLLDTGIRATELVTLTIGNVFLDAKDPHIRVYGKGRKWGEVGMGEQTRRTIARYIRQFREPTIEHQIAAQLVRSSPRESQQMKRQAMSQARLFMSRAGKPMTKSGLYQVIERLGEWAGIEGVRCSPHTFRHTFSVMFIRNGGDIYRLSKLLRHSSVSTTEHYLRSLKQSEARKGAKSVLDNL